jgi:nitronate monooxygenase
MTNPVLIQGGMGVGVSNWRLARAVSQADQLGVVSGTIIDTVFIRRLQDGDRDGKVRYAAAHFPDTELAQRVVNRYYIEGGRKPNQAYVNGPMFSMKPSKALLELVILANFTEVFLAKDGHRGLVGINYLEKVQLPTLPSLYGAMLADVDYVLMGAGIPKAIPGILDKLAHHEPVALKLDLDSKSDTTSDATLYFNPREIINIDRDLKRPQFIAIVSSHTLAANLAKKSSGKVDGFVIENHTAGGHNAPPRGPLTLTENGEPLYGQRDQADLEQMKKLGLPFWLAGAQGNRQMLEQALKLGACGIQVGTPFAFCEESGISKDIKATTLAKAQRNEIAIFTDPLASASGYPFKVAIMEDSLSQEETYETRTRICDLGYLRTAFTRADGSIGFRCPGEDAKDYVQKGGCQQETTGRKCLCNALLSTIGLGQLRANGYEEPPILTCGDSINKISDYLKPGEKGYTAQDVIDKILVGA